MLSPGQPKAVALECPSCGPENGLRGDEWLSPPSRRIIKGCPFEVGFECAAELYRVGVGITIDS